MENSITTLDIVSLCLKLDLAAKNIYDRFTNTCQNQGIKNFWLETKTTKERHIEFWKTIIKLSSKNGLPEIFDTPDSVAKELKLSLNKTQEILKKAENSNSILETFLIAYRLEFYMMNPAFELLFHILGRNVEGLNPETDYMTHIKGFDEILKKHGLITPELELLGETLLHIWKESNRIARQTIIDELTSAYNRRGFMVVAEQLAELSRRNQSGIGIILIDIDHFKKINEEQGHHIGDRMLKQISAIIKSSLRASDMVGRYGGDEFIIFLPEVRDKGANLVAEKIRSAVEEANIEKTGVSVSIGAMDGHIEKEPQEFIWEMIKQSESYLYAAKKGGRNMVMGNT